MDLKWHNECTISKRTTCLGNVSPRKGNSKKQKQSKVYIKLNK